LFWAAPVRYHGWMLSGAAATTISRGQWAVALVLLLGVVTIGLGALYAWWRRLAAQPSEGTAADAEHAPAQRVCPTCARRYPGAARYCAIDATALAWVEGELTSSTSLSCPRCERSYNGVRFCPFDAEELVRAEQEAGEHHHLGTLLGADKICPTCAARYELGAAFCGKDGTRLLALH
jgi:hypothetical protein